MLSKRYESTEVDRRLKRVFVFIVLQTPYNGLK